MHGRVLLTEALGSEILAHVEIDAKPVVTDDVVEGAVADAEEHELAADLCGDSGNGDKTTFVGRFDPVVARAARQRRRAHRRHREAAVLRSRDGSRASERGPAVNPGTCRDSRERVVACDAVRARGRRAPVLARPSTAAPTSASFASASRRRQRCSTVGRAVVSPGHERPADAERRRRARRPRPRARARSAAPVRGPDGERLVVQCRPRARRRQGRLSPRASTGTVSSSTAATSRSPSVPSEAEAFATGLGDDRGRHLRARFDGDAVVALPSARRRARPSRGSTQRCSRISTRWSRPACVTTPHGSRAPPRRHARGQSRPLYRRSLLTLDLLDRPQQRLRDRRARARPGLRALGRLRLRLGARPRLHRPRLPRRGPDDLAKRALRWLPTAQEPEGLWLQRHWTDGSLAPSWCKHQLDETGAILFAYEAAWQSAWRPDARRRPLAVGAPCRRVPARDDRGGRHPVCDRRSLGGAGRPSRLHRRGDLWRAARSGVDGASSRAGARGVVRRSGGGRSRRRSSASSGATSTAATSARSAIRRSTSRCWASRGRSLPSIRAASGCARPSRRSRQSSAAQRRAGVALRGRHVRGRQPLGARRALARPLAPPGRRQRRDSSGARVRATPRRPNLGLLPEQVTDDGEPAWVVPLAWSHAMLLLAAASGAAARPRARRGRSYPPRAGLGGSRPGTVAAWVYLAVPQPYDFELSLDRFTFWGVDRANVWHDGGLHRVVDGPRGPDHAGRPAASTPSRSTRTIEPVVRKLLGLEFDLEPFRAFAARASRSWRRPSTGSPGFRPPLAPDPFEALVSSITAQQVSLHAAFAVRSRFIERFGEPGDLARSPSPHASVSHRRPRRS